MKDYFTFTVFRGNKNFTEFENVGAECIRQTIKLENSFDSLKINHML